MSKKMVIKRNRAKCKYCGEILESVFTHNFVTCSCGSLSIDGGKEYLKRCANKLDDFEDMSEVEFVDE